MSDRLRSPGRAQTATSLTATSLTRALLIATALIAASLLTVGCASMPVADATRPEPTLDVQPPSQWASPSGEAEPSESAVTGSSAEPSALAASWWHDFQSPELDRLIDRVLERNPTLQVAAANVEAAMAQARIEGAALSPQLSAGLNGSRRKQNFIGLPIPGAEDRILSTTSSNFGLALNVSWEADLWGRLSSAKKAALSDAAANVADLDAARLSIAGQATKGWLSMIEASQQVALTERALETRRSSERRILARYRRGLSGSLDVRLSRSQSERLEAQLSQRRQALDALRRQLEVLAGDYPAGRLDLTSTLPEPPPGIAHGVPADVLARRPDLRAAELRAVSASARLRAARRALYPSLSLTGSSGTASGALGDLLDGNLSVWSLAAGLLQPIFQGGRLRAGVDLREAGLDATEAVWLDTALRAFLEVETALEAEHRLDQQVSALAEAARQSAAAERLALDRYYGGLADYLSVLESQRSAFESESQLLATRRERLAARVDLILALGGGVAVSDRNQESATIETGTRSSD